MSLSRSHPEAGFAAALLSAAGATICSVKLGQTREDQLVPMMIAGGITALVLGPIATDARDRVHRWSPAIFWALVAALFCLLLERDAPRVAYLALSGSVALAVIAGWLATFAGWLGIASALAAGVAIVSSASVEVSAAAAILPLWARSAFSLAEIRAAVPNRIAADLATCFGAGYTPKGSGTVGAVTAIPFGWMLAQTDPVVRAGILAAATAASIGVSYWYMAGRSGDLDPKEVVLDEHIGVLLAFAVVPWEWWWVLAAFVLFRIFDIWKPPPVGLIDRKMKNPAGVMMDDVAAGLMAAGVLLVLRASL